LKTVFLNACGALRAPFRPNEVTSVVANDSGSQTSGVHNAWIGAVAQDDIAVPERSLGQQVGRRLLFNGRRSAMDQGDNGDTKFSQGPFCN
jgi:hypothetical protein